MTAIASRTARLNPWQKEGEPGSDPPEHSIPERVRIRCKFRVRVQCNPTDEPNRDGRQRDFGAVIRELSVTHRDGWLEMLWAGREQQLNFSDMAFLTT